MAIELYSSLEAVNSHGTIVAIAEQVDGQDKIVLRSLPHDEINRVLDWSKEYGTVKLISRDGSTLISEPERGRVMVWNDAFTSTFQAPEKNGTTLALSPDDKTLFIGTNWSNDPTDQSQLWNLSDGTLLMTLKGYRSFIKKASFSPDAKKVVTIEGDHTLNLWRTSDGMLLQQLTNQVH